ncbi:MAG: hypothetical protein K9H48_17545 [Melioribacteraceae bacterium]|nr:hypothetical protein [Melioribacteraceae bacterium]MCF8395708.1 hypothetical protein [Melioribacteraceae bacterium]MCF8421221.1 hypothetical protein [Melioribacteraceae bacterium]
MRCEDCGAELSEDEVRWGHDYPYCEDCFEERFNYCSRCDTLIYREHTQWDEDGDPYCDDCYDTSYDCDCPNNPDVYSEDRQLIKTLSNNWIHGIKEAKYKLKINQSDHFLQEIQIKTGLIDYPLYLYGLVDREEYQIKASENIIDQVNRFAEENNWELNIVPDTGTNRLGISKSIRANHLDSIVKLIKEVQCAE